MKNFRRVTKGFVFIIFFVFILGPFIKEIDLKLVIKSALFIFLAEFIYYFIEKKSDVILISTGDISHYRRNSIFILGLSVLSIFLGIYESGINLRYFVPGIILGYCGLRGVLFTKQTVASIRIFQQGFEYGFWNKYISWKSILNYEKSNDEYKIEIERSGLIRNITIKFDAGKDMDTFERVLKKMSDKDLSKK